MQHVPRPNLRWLRVACLLVGAAIGVPGDATVGQGREVSHERGIDALAAAHVVASGFAGLSGVAVESVGTLLVTDRIAGTLSRISASGESRVVLRELHRPEGVAAGTDGDVYVLEAGAGRILRLLADGTTLVAAGGLKQPSALAAGRDGRIWVAAHGQGGDVVARLEPSGGLTDMLSGLEDVRALAVNDATLFVATSTSVVRVPLGPDGSAGRATPMLRRWRSRGMVAAPLGGLYISGWPVGAGGAARAGILKYDGASGHTARFATGLRRPGALALEPSGHLLAADVGPHGRLWRFMAPPAPVVSLPDFTSQSSVSVMGTADRGARVQALAQGAVQAVAMADEATGRFSMTTALAPNAETALLFVATAAGGAGLAGATAREVIVHDDRPPRVTLTSPAAAAYIRDAAVLVASATDDGSRMASIRLLLGDADVARAETALGESRLAVQAVVDVARTPEGMHTLTALAADRAGNHASAAQLVVIDRTPPDAALVEHPDARIPEGAAAFSFAATDLLSPVLEFSWRLDGADWSPYQTGTRVVFQRLAAGSHSFEVRARDLAGNEDITPAPWEFQVGAVRLDVAEPGPGTVVTTPTVWVRGEASGTAPVTVSIPLPEEFRILAKAISAPVVGGRFALEVPVVAGRWSAVVTAADGTGATAVEAVDVRVLDALTPPTRVPAVPAAGVAPHQVQFGVGSLPIGTYTIDLESDGTVDYSGERPDGRQFTYGTSGAFLATIAVVTPGGLSLQWRAAVTAYDRSGLETELYSTWNGLKQAMRLGEPDQAASFIHTARRAVWRDYFAQLGAAAMSTGADAALTDIEFVGFEGDRVECEMMRAVDGLMFSFPVSFAMDTDGRWRLWQF